MVKSGIGIQNKHFLKDNSLHYRILTTTIEQQLHINYEKKFQFLSSSVELNSTQQEESHSHGH